MQRRLAPRLCRGGGRPSRARAGRRGIPIALLTAGLWLACVGGDRASSEPALDAASLAEAAELCGEEIVPIERFVVVHGADTYSLPRNVEILRSGRRIYADPEPSEWRAPLGGVASAAWGPELLIRTFERDCVDRYRARLFLIGADGSVVHQPLWTSHWRAGFFEQGGRLQYWSEWFCQADNPERGGDAAFVYAWSPEDRSFSRVPADPKLCAEADDIAFLEFQPARAIPRSGAR